LDETYFYWMDCVMF